MYTSPTIKWIKMIENTRQKFITLLLFITLQSLHSVTPFVRVRSKLVLSYYKLFFGYSTSTHVSSWEPRWEGAEMEINLRSVRNLLIGEYRFSNSTTRKDKPTLQFVQSQFYFNYSLYKVSSTWTALYTKSVHLRCSLYSQLNLCCSLC